MSDDNVNVDDSDEQTNPNEDNLRALRDKAKAADDAARENAELKRQLMFVKAGIDTESKVGSMLFRTWSGDDLEALKAEAVELGLVDKPAEQSFSSEEATGQMQMREQLSGGKPPTSAPPTKDPTTEAYELFWDARKKGVPQDDARLIAIDKVLTSGVAGDKRVIFDQREWDRQAAAHGHQPNA